MSPVIYNHVLLLIMKQEEGTAFPWGICIFLKGRGVGLSMFLCYVLRNYSKVANGFAADFLLHSSYAQTLSVQSNFNTQTTYFQCFSARCTMSAQSGTLK